MPTTFFRLCAPTLSPLLLLPSFLFSLFLLHSQHLIPHILAMGKRLSQLFGFVPSDVRRQQNQDNSDRMMQRRWGPRGSEGYEMIMRYWIATRMQQHWEYLRREHPNEFSRLFQKGYMEPVPTQWVYNRRLAIAYAEGSYWETPAEKRL